MFSRFGAEAFAERARRELLATGVTAPKRTVETRDILTPQEAQIARRLATGVARISGPFSLPKRSELVREAIHRLAVQEGSQLTGPRRVRPARRATASAAGVRRSPGRGPPEVKRRSASDSHTAIGYTQSTPTSR
jgi:hypothetical protein